MPPAHFNFLSVEGIRQEVIRFKPRKAVAPRPAIILLHEGLGSVAMWRDFPGLLAEKTGCEVIAYSRAGYGKSDPARLPRKVSYMHDEGLHILPKIIHALDVKAPILLGHSDGASIALICAGGTDIELGGLIVMAPHIMVEPITVESIAQAKIAWQTTLLSERLVKYHNDAEATFWGWNDIWLNPDFRAWTIKEYLPSIRVPVLAIQGLDDEYGTMAQIDGIVEQLPSTETLKLEGCRHSPHKDQCEAVIDAVQNFLLTSQGEKI